MNICQLILLIFLQVLFVLETLKKKTTFSYANEALSNKLCIYFHT